MRSSDSRGVELEDVFRARDDGEPPFCLWCLEPGPVRRRA